MSAEDLETRAPDTSSGSVWRAEMGKLIAASYARNPGVAAAFIYVFEISPRQGVAELGALVGEVYELIEHEMPEIDMERLQYFFRYNRCPWDAPPNQ